MTDNNSQSEARINMQPVRRLLARHRLHTDKYEVLVADLKLIMHPGVLCPAYTKTSQFLADFVVVPQGAVVLDMFSGSGFQAILAARSASRVLAVDNSPLAISCIEENVRYHNLESKIEVRQSDLFYQVRGDELFDVIIANPPLLPGLPSDYLESAVLDPGLGVTIRFLESLSNHLAPNGRVFLLFSDASSNVGGGIDLICEVAKRSSLRVCVLATRDVGYETYYILMLDQQ